MLIKRVILYLFFAGFLASPIIIKHQSGNNFEVKNANPADFSLRQFGFFLSDVTKDAGVDFVHQSPQLDPKLNHILPQIASMGASVSVVDFDRDGWNDFYLTSSRYGSKNALYHNERDGTFKNIAGSMGVADVNKSGTGVSMGAIWGDYDNDGYEDLFIYKWGRSELYKNLRGIKFEKATEILNFPEWANVNAALWLDYNSDGYLDLFVGGYYPPEIDLWHLATTRIMPESFEYANNGGRNYLFENQGDGKFIEIAEKAGLTSTRWTLAAGAADLSGSGYPDLIIANDYGVDEYYINLQGQGFKEVGADLGLGFAPKSGMNVTFGDIQNEGSLGIYITNITQEGVLLQGNNFWKKNKGDNKFNFLNIARQRGIELGGWSYGAQFGDLNNDGAQDLYVANGFISAQKGTTYWYDYSKVTGGNRAIISDASNWPDMKGRSQSGYQRNKIWLNDGSGFFQEVAELAGDHATFDSRSIVMVDLWNRGVLDMIIANQNAQTIIYKNTVNKVNHWIDFDLTGSQSNRSAIGAKVDLIWDNKIQTQVISGGIGFCAQNQRRVHFGIGSVSQIEKAVIYWPSGKIQEILQPQLDQLYYITEEI